MESIFRRWVLLSCGVTAAGWLPAASAFVPPPAPGVHVVPPHNTGVGPGTKDRTPAGSMASVGSFIRTPWLRSSLTQGVSMQASMEGLSGVLTSRKRKQRSSLLRRMADVEVIDSIERGESKGGSGPPTEEMLLKKKLLDQIDLASSSEKRTAVNELILKLESLNPTPAPSRSWGLNGVWEFLYTGGLTPGTVAVQVLSRVAKRTSLFVDLKGVMLTIKRDQPRVEASVKLSLFQSEPKIAVHTRLEVRSDVRLEEIYEEAEVAGVKIPLPARLRPRRTLFVTYLDEDIMIARDDKGAPDLLIRKQKEDRFNTGTPSMSEDDTSPGS